MKIEKINQDTFQQLEISKWPIWTKEVSSFPWKYDQTEICFILEGEAEISLQNGEILIINKGDLVTFEAGLSCHWNIRKAIRKHYTFV